MTATAGARTKADEGSQSIADDLRQSGLIGGIDPARLAEQFGTPLYVYDLDMVGRRVAALRTALPRRFRLAYAVKANPALAIVAEMARLAVGADVASGGELATALRAGIDPVRIVMTGPGKRDEELRSAVVAGVAAVTVESPGELLRLEEAAAEAERRQPVLLRLAIGEGEDGPRESVQLIGGRGGAKFGMDLETLRSAAARAVASPHLDLLGVHAFGASNLTDAAALVRHVGETAAVARLVAEETGTRVRLVDAGGGLGIAYAEGEPSLDLEVLRAVLEALRTAFDADPLLRDADVLLEPGRFLVGPAGVYMARVVDVKGGATSPIAVLDGGIHHAVRPALVRTEHRVRLVGPAASESRELVSALVAGPLCTGLDVFATAARIPSPRPGDLVALTDVGAYGFTESMPLFLSHPTPPEVAVRGGEARLIRPRITPAELLDRQVVPDW